MLCNIQRWLGTWHFVRSWGKHKMNRTQEYPREVTASLGEHACANWTVMQDAIWVSVQRHVAIIKQQTIRREQDHEGLKHSGEKFDRQINDERKQPTYVPDAPGSTLQRRAPLNPITSHRKRHWCLSPFCGRRHWGFTLSSNSSGTAGLVKAKLRSNPRSLMQA